MEKIIDYIANYRRGQKPPVIFFLFLHIFENAHPFFFFDLPLGGIILKSHHFSGRVALLPAGFFHPGNDLPL